jgi:hypothetical protein
MRDTPSSEELIKRAKADFAPTVYSRTYTVISRAEDIEAMIEETMNSGAIAEMMAENMAEAMDAEAMLEPGVGPDVRMPEFRRPSTGRPPEHAPRVEHMQVPPAPLPSDSPVGFGSDAGADGNGALRAVGLFILLAIAGFWLLLLIGAVQDPDNAGSVIGGGIVLTAIPFVIAVLLIRRARKAKQSQGLIT